MATVETLLSESDPSPDKPIDANVSTDKPVNKEPPPFLSPSPAGFKMPTLPLISKVRKSDSFLAESNLETNPETESETTETAAGESIVEPVKNEDTPVPDLTDPQDKVKDDTPSPDLPDTPVQPNLTRPTKSPAEIAKANSIPLPYQEPSWGGVPENKYYLEVLKTGTIVDTIHLKDKSFFTVGRLANCDIILEHPSLSRYHAVLQFKAKGSPEKPVGFYLFDLDSTHGSYHNKNKCFPKTYYRLRVGHIIKFGGSTRSLILQGPDEDSEEESEHTVTELKSLAAERARLKMERKLEMISKSREDKEDGEECGEGGDGGDGVSWGMGDDAEEFPDMDQNPFAETADNESLYINDPKKALKNWFDREGCELEYQVEEKGYAQFLCKIDLPVDSPNGGPQPTAEALVKGKKKEATIQAALEACRILDRMGLLRPSKQAAVERKIKKWEEDDFYASDEDEFLDRTGSIERKRKTRMRMAGKGEETVETYETLMKKHEENKSQLLVLETELKEALLRKEKADKRSQSNDLDNYLAELKKGAQVDKETVQKLKMKILSFNQDQERLTKLINIARPASMPELKSSSKPDKPQLSGIMIGKRGSKGLLGKVKTVDKDNKTPVFCHTTDTKVLEAFLSESDPVKPKRKHLEDEDEEEDSELQPIGYETRPEPKPKERIGDTSVNKTPRVLGPATPDDLSTRINATSEPINQDEPTVEPKTAVTQSSLPPSYLGSLAEEDSEEKRKRGDRGTKRRKKVDEDEEDEKEDYYKVGMDRKYDVWLPPTNQTGDGRTSLNDKLGY